MKTFFSRLFPDHKTERNTAPQDEITIVSGLPRSGTSLMMKMLEAGGLSILTDNVRTADTDNLGGYYEFERVKALYKGDIAWLPSAQGKVVKVISTLLPNLPSNYQYRILFMRRDMAEVLASQKKMLVNRGEDPDKFNDAQIAAIFEKNLRQVEEWLHSNPNVKWMDVNYNQLLREPEPLVAKVNEFFGGNLETSVMMGAINPDLYRQRLAK
jgi:hypothetical protein